MDKVQVAEFIRLSKEANARPEPMIENDREEFIRAPHCWFLGVVMDRGMPFEKAWKIPYEIAKREFGGNVEFSLFASLSRGDCQRIFDTPPYLHRYKNKMGECFYLAIRKIVEDYDSDVRKIWEGNKSAYEVIARLKEFKGVGDKISTMCCNILYRELGVKFSDLRAINISPDVHVQRVFYRLGLIWNIMGDPTDVMMAASRLNPEYPGVFDLLCWEIGKDRICVNDIRKCRCAECPINRFCPQKA